MRTCVALFLAACAGSGTHGATPTTRNESTLALIEARPDLDGTRIGADEHDATLAIVLASWCPHCHEELAVIDRVRASHPHARIVGIDYAGHEEYDGRGSLPQLRTYLADHAPWLRVVPADEALFAALGRPAQVPSIYVFNGAGVLVETFARADRPMPDESELAAALEKAGS